MKISKNIVNDPRNNEKLYLSTLAINSVPFLTSKIFEGGYGKLDKYFYVTRVKNKGYQSIVFSLSGQGKIIFEDDSEILLKPGSAFFSSATGRAHKEEVVGDDLWEMLWFSTYKDSPNLIIHSPDYQLVENVNFDFVKECFLDIFNEELYSDLRSLEAIELHERLFILSIERIFGITEPLRVRENRRKLQKMWAQVSNTPENSWSINELCNYINLSRSQLSRICKELYNKTPAEIVRGIKIDHAKVLLRSTTYPISVISERIGYANSNNFSTTFKSVTKTTPQNFRKEYLNSKTNILSP